MKNYKFFKNLIFALLTLFLSCKKFESNNVAIKSEQEKSITNTHSSKDTVSIDIDDNYYLKINSKEQNESIDYLQPIKKKLINEEIYAQVLYDKKNIIINLEIGLNADVYEDIFLSKTKPLILERIIKTTIIKNDTVNKVICEQIINKAFLTISRYRTINFKDEECKTEMQK